MSASELRAGRDQAVAVVVDVQEGFRSAIKDFDAVTKNVSILVQAAKIIELPILVTEQYPKGLGTTVDEVACHLDGAQKFEKVCFSASDAEEFMAALNASGRKQVLLCGIEAHICVSQSALQLRDRGFSVHVLADATASRTAENREIGLAKMERAGAVISSTETALFELLGKAGSEEFKAIQELIR